jgi:hypothetical protein
MVPEQFLSLTPAGVPVLDALGHSFEMRGRWVVLVLAGVADLLRLADGDALADADGDALADALADAAGEAETDADVSVDGLPLVLPCPDRCAGVPLTL